MYEFDAPWRIELPQGGAVWGTASNANASTWPDQLNSLPPNRLIVRASDSGSGKVVEDNLATINAQLATYNAGKSASPSGGGCAAGRGARSSSALIAASLVALALLRRRRGIGRR